MALSKTQIDKLGERLKAGQPTESDLRELDEYRRTFGAAYETAFAIPRKFTKREPTGRAKSNASIIEKLRRESIRLTQIQDIAGCRIIVADTSAQNRAVMRLVDGLPEYGLTGEFPGATVIDRREHPSHGYRAVHVVPHIEGRSIEIQIRTELQHRWAIERLRPTQG